MLDEAAYVEHARLSEYFSGARIAEVLRGFLSTQAGEIRAMSRDLGSVEHLFLVGSGGSYANLLTAKYILDRLLPIPSDVVPSYELIWRKPHLITDKSLILFASLSGETEDTLAAHEYAQSRGAATVAVVGNADSQLAKASNYPIPFEGAACYEIPLAASLLLGAAITERHQDSRLASELLDGLKAIPNAIDGMMDGEPERARQAAELFRDSEHMFVLGAGPLGALAYKFAMSVIMENLRITATYSDAVEFRHGPAEALERQRPDFVVMVGTDESRAVSMRVLDFCESRSTRFLVYDAGDYAPVHPLLTPLVMNSALQWFIVYSAYRRGITNLDDRVFMGRGLLAAGAASWP